MKVTKVFVLKTKREDEIIKEHAVRVVVTVDASDSCSSETLRQLNELIASTDWLLENELSNRPV